MGRRYHLLLFAYLVSSLGNWIYRLTLPLLVLKLTGSALSTAAVYVLEYAPFLLLSIPGGLIADRVNRRRLLVGGDLAAGCFAAAITLLLGADVRQLWPIFLLAFLLACVEPIYHPAFYSWLPQLVDDERAAGANAWMQSSDNIVSLAGPVLAGGLVTFFGHATAVAVDAATFAVSALAILLIRATGPVPTTTGPADRRTPRAVAAELREARHHIFTENRVLLAGSLTFTGTNFAIWLMQANLVYYLTTYRHLSPTQIGVVLAAQGVGSLLGSAAAARLLTRVHPPHAIIGCTAAAGLAMLALIPMRDPVTISAAWGLANVFGAMNVVAWFTYRHRIVPAHLMGRVVAITRMVAFSSIPVAALLGGYIENTIHNMYAIIAIAGGLRLAVALLALRSPLASQPTTPTEPTALATTQPTTPAGDTPDPDR
jgi:MFS family permease